MWFSEDAWALGEEYVRTAECGCSLHICAVRVEVRGGALDGYEPEQPHWSWTFKTCGEHGEDEDGDGERKLLVASMIERAATPDAILASLIES